MLHRFILFLFLALLFGCDAQKSLKQDDSFTLYLVRHCEKAKEGGKDPLLTEAGKASALRLATTLGDKGVRKVYSSDYHRTRDTARPLADRLGQEVMIYNPSCLLYTSPSPRD